jgi:hypothetical protein
VIFSLKREINFAIHYNMDETCRHYASETSQPYRDIYSMTSAIGDTHYSQIHKDR